jgi:hypothetical protein
MDASLNIVELIENNPITKLSSSYNGKLLTKIKEGFTDFEQQLFVSSFYCYLNCDQKNDFVIELDNVWKWLDFTAKSSAKRILEQNFTIDKDYTKSLHFQVKQVSNNLASGAKKSHGGHNKETIMLTVKTFKSLCLKAGTKKADEIHDYYLKMEEIIHQVVQEESDELKLQLDQANNKIKTTLIQTEKEKEHLVEQTLFLQFPVNTQCIYYGRIDNRSLGQAHRVQYNEQLIKFGQSNNLAERIAAHKKIFTNFRLVAAFKVKNKIEIENCMKRHPVLKKRVRSLMIDGLNHRELLALDDGEFTIEKMDEHIKQIIKENEYNIENYNLLLEKNEKLEDEIRKLENEAKEKDKQIDTMTKELIPFKCDVSNAMNSKIENKNVICKYGYLLYAFECSPSRFKCSIIQQKDYEIVLNNLLMLDPEGTMRHTVKVSYTLCEKILKFLMRETMTGLGNNVFEGSLNDVKKMLDITVQFEKVLMENGKDLDKLMRILKQEPLDNIQEKEKEEEKDPETPTVRKAKRAIDQIHKDTGEVVATYASIEAAGRTMGLTTGTAIGIALREKRVCQGFLWRYAGISKEDQYSEQPVVRFNCKTGVKTEYKTIADAAREVGISAPGMRQRILTNVHIHDHHWEFDKTATHYLNPL